MSEREAGVGTGTVTLDGQRAAVALVVADWFDTGYEAGRLDPGVLTDRVLAVLGSTSPLDEAWAAAEAALPPDWVLELTVGSHGRRDLYTATASYSYSLRYYRENVGPARSTPFEMEHADSPAAALQALASALQDLAAALQEGVS